LRILTNICELDLENPQLYRIVGYKLDQEGALEQSINVFKKVLKLRNNEPQSHRDLGLVISRSGDYEEALIHLWDVVTGQWDYRFDEIELTALIEINRLLWRAQQEKKKITLPDGLDNRFKHDVGMDIRISMAWDTDNTDIDLHVIEPHGEECYFSHKLTQYGGTISRDFTGGYGPEEYMCKRAPQGNYRIRAKYFASHQQSLSGGTTVLVSIYTNFSRKDEDYQMLTLRLQTNADIVDVGNIDFVPTTISDEASKKIKEMDDEIAAKKKLIQPLDEAEAKREKDRPQELKKVEEEVKKKKEDLEKLWKQEDEKTGK